MLCGIHALEVCTVLRGFFTELPRLETERLVLRPVTLDDVPAVHQYCSDPDVARYTTWHPHRSLAESQAYVIAVQDQYRRDEPSPWGVEHRGERVLIGTCGFVARTPEHHRAELGYTLARPYWGQGYMTEAARAVIEYAFTNLDVNRIQAMCDAENLASARVLEKSGMRLEGILRDYLLIKGRYRNVRMYSVVRENRLP